MLIIANSTCTFAQNGTHVVTEGCMEIKNNTETVFVFNQIWSLRIFMDFDEIRYRVPTADWKIWLRVCWSNTFDFYGRKWILTKFSNHFVPYKMMRSYNLATLSHIMNNTTTQGHHFLTLSKVLPEINLRWQEFIYTRNKW